MTRLMTFALSVALVAGCGGPGRQAAPAPAANVRILMFWTPRLSACQGMNRVVELYEKETGRTVERVNVDEDPDLARKYEVTTLPTVLVVDEKQVMVNKVVGYVPIQTLRSNLARHFEGSAGQGR